MSAADNLNGAFGTAGGLNLPESVAKLSNETIEKLGGEQGAAAHIDSRKLTPTDPFYTHMDNTTQSITDRRRLS